jgi:iron complex outermembrane recepter protein
MDGGQVTIRAFGLTALRAIAATLLLAASSRVVAAQAAGPELTRISLEDLMNIEITSASRKEQRAADTAAAVHVITSEDIRRSGITTLPELFRLVPGVQVAQINSNNWAISARGFNDLWANKLLVLVDGRSIYTRSFSGVFWGANDLMLEDIDRIEVIRGPGASVWGANAVNGVINIVTRAASETQGALVKVGAGTSDRAAGAVRYGGSIGRASYRVSSQWADHSSSLSSATGQPAGDNWQELVNSLRTDWSRGSNALTTESSVQTTRSWPLWTSFTGPSPALSGLASDRPASMVNGNALARWTHTFSDRSSVQLQSYVDLRSRHDGNGMAQQDDTVDLDAEVHRTLSHGHDLVAGGGYRAGRIVTDGTFIYSVADRSIDTSVMNAFVQDEISVNPRLRLILGSKLEHDFIAGWGVQPTARFIWSLTPSSQHVWGAVSRALRTPSVNDLGMRVNYFAFTGERGVPVVLGLTGNPDYQAERLLDIEGGYRAEVGSKLSADITVFHGHYSGLPTQEPMAPVFETSPGAPHVFIGTRFANLLDENTTGLELDAHWTPLSALRLDAGYSGLRMTPLPDAASHDATAASQAGNAPTHQWQVHASTRVNPRVELDGGLYFVGRLRALDVPAYTRLDAQTQIKLSQPLSIAITGQNLVDRGHLEFADGNTGLTATSIPRSVGARLIWTF